MTGPDPSPGESGGRRWIRTILSFLSRAASCEGGTRGHWLAQDILGSHVERKNAQRAIPGAGCSLRVPYRLLLAAWVKLTSPAYGVKEQGEVQKLPPPCPKA